MSKPKVKIWPTRLPYKGTWGSQKNDRFHNDYVLAQTEGDALKFIEMRKLGERLITPDDRREGYPFYKHVVTRSQPRTLSLHLQRRKDMHTSYGTVSNGQYMARFMELAVSSGASTFENVIKMARDILTFGCDDQTVIDAIRMIEDEIPGHTRQYALRPV